MAINKLKLDLIAPLIILILISTDFVTCTKSFQDLLNETSLSRHSSSGWFSTRPLNTGLRDTVRNRFYWRNENYLGAPNPVSTIVEASQAKFTQAARFKRNPLMPFSHAFGLNATFCSCIAAACRVWWLTPSPSNHRTRVQFALGLRTHETKLYGV